MCKYFDKSPNRKKIKTRFHGLPSGSDRRVTYTDMSTCTYVIYTDAPAFAERKTGDGPMLWEYIYDYIKYIIINNKNLCGNTFMITETSVDQCCRCFFTTPPKFFAVYSQPRQVLQITGHLPFRGNADLGRLAYICLTVRSDRFQLLPQHKSRTRC